MSNKTPKKFLIPKGSRRKGPPLNTPLNQQHILSMTVIATASLMSPWFDLIKPVLLPDTNRACMDAVITVDCTDCKKNFSLYTC